jgi:hypothetical protein
LQFRLNRFEETEQIAMRIAMHPSITTCFMVSAKRFDMAEVLWFELNSTGSPSYRFGSRAAVGNLAQQGRSHPR